ncbi:hypothetical protein BGZ99_000306 [Dissophora globulifera]|uniref:Major facilitator superfamily (MFS) profile domain-containing protein n=1 Tax=Dissophora globulifera TaxID=979702 RepID=A0A9P6R3V2_9FUNG|nr:hypothetical protein BGZ99_000306 [Dissophora globulifera]
MLVDNTIPQELEAVQHRHVADSHGDDMNYTDEKQQQQQGTGSLKAGQPIVEHQHVAAHLEDLDSKTADGQFDHNSEAVQRVRWKVDKRLIPMLSLLYLCSFLDRVNIGNAKVANLEQDLSLKPGAYNLALSIFFAGYVLGEIPANLMLKKIGPRRWVPMVMFCWGVVSMCMSAVNDGTGLIVARFFLGLAESGYAPGPVYIISLWYRRCEQALRIGIFFSAATVAGAFGGLLSYGIARLNGLGGLHAWQWIFILEGLPTILCCFLAFAVLPDFPETSTFLAEDEKALCVQRLRIDAGSATDTGFSRSQVWAAFRDPKVYGHIVLGSLHSVAFTSLGLFVPSITLSFGFDPVTTQIMTAPVYACACICTLFFAISSDRFSERGYHAALATSLAAIGYILLIVTRYSSLAARYVSLIICTSGVYSFVPIALSWPSSNIGGHTKKGVAIAAIISISQVGGFAGGQLYREDDAPLYVRGHTISACLLVVDTLLILGFKFLLRRENRRRDRLSPEEYDRECRQSDKTDTNPDFRYFE